MIPKQITYQDVVRALRFVAINSYPNNRKSKTWDLHFEGETYPPKYIISKAAEFSSYGKFFYHNQFDSGDARNYLRKLKFTVLQRDKFSNIIILDDLVPHNQKRKSKKDLMIALQRLTKLPPAHKEVIIEQTLRGDSPLIKVLKEIYNYKCQMTGCNAIIRKKNGELYCEVAHISPFSRTKTSIPDNLIVLCPNHHKEFDLGDREITDQSENMILGILNGRKFKFVLKL